jgi:peptidoglycan/LPS O-acetylase OafA/YrhL
MGVALALVVVFRPMWWEALRQRGHLLMLGGAGCLGGVAWMLRERNLGDDTGSARWALIVGFPLLSLGLMLITASAMSANGWLARVRVPGAKTVASLAFALYLTHKAVAHLVMVHLPGIAAEQGPVSWVLYAAACLGAAVVLHLCVERPFLYLRDRGGRPKTTREVEMEIQADPAV